MTTTYHSPDDPSILSEQVKFLAEFSWIYNFQLTRFFVDKVWEKIPVQWLPCLRDMTVDDLKNLPLGKLQDDWPADFQQFVQSAMKFVRDRELRNDRKPVEIDKFSQRGMTPKKKHEVSNMASLVDVISQKSGSDVIIDVGSGLGYLGQVLNKSFGYKVIGLESKNCHTTGADRRINKQECDSEILNITFELQNDGETLTEFESVIFSCLKDHRVSDSKTSSSNSENHCKGSSQTKYSVAQKHNTKLPSGLCNAHETSDERNICYTTLEECDTVSAECNKMTSDRCKSSDCKRKTSEDKIAACVRYKCKGGNKASSTCNTPSECNISDQCNVFSECNTVSNQCCTPRECNTSNQCCTSSESSGNTTYGRCNTSSECNKTSNQFCTPSGGNQCSWDYDKADRLAECNTSQQCNTTSCECNITSRNYNNTSYECNTANQCSKSSMECSTPGMECNIIPDERFTKSECTTCAMSSDTGKTSCEFNNKTCEPNKSIERGPDILSASTISSTSDTNPDCIDKPSVLMIGLHCCGDLTPTMMNYFSKLDFVKGLCCVSCCYHRMKFHDDSKTFDNFPLSRTLKTVMIQEKCWSPDVFSMRLAAQETRARWTNQSEQDHQTHMKHVAYRGILEYHLNQEKVGCGKLFRRIVKKSDFNTFQSYVDAACFRVDLESLTESVDIDDVKRNLWSLHEEFKDKFEYVEPLTALQVMIQPIIEDLIYTDRLLWLKENGHQGEIIPVFDEFISPRNLALLALK